MKYNPEVHHRRSIRLKDYDYSQARAYFITICVQNRQCLFGEVAGGKMILNDAGCMVQTIWDEIPRYYGMQIDQFQIMPNHIHGIIIIVGAGPRACPESESESNPKPHTTPDPNTRRESNGQPIIIGQSCGDGQPQGGGQPQGVAPTMTLGDVVHRFKTMTTKQYCDGVKQLGWQKFDGKLWQRNYYEHIIRNNDDLNRIREYIIHNPILWERDDNNPAVKQ